MSAYTIEADTKPGSWGLCSDGFYRLLETNGFVQDVPVLSNFDQIEAYEFFNITAAEARRLFPDNLERPSFPDEDYRRGWIQKRVRTQRIVWRSIVSPAGIERHQGTIAEAIEAAEKLTNYGEWAIKEPSMFDRTGSGWVEIAAESDDPEIQKRRASAKGGAARTEKKATAAAANGAKGGRPVGFRKCKPADLRLELCEQYFESLYFSHKIIEAKKSPDYQALIVDSTVYLMVAAGHHKVIKLELMPGDDSKARGKWFDGTLQILSLRTGKLL